MIAGVTVRAHAASVAASAVGAALHDGRPLTWVRLELAMHAVPSVSASTRVPSGAGVARAVTVATHRVRCLVASVHGA
jgi:hypothetical protein